MLYAFADFWVAIVIFMFFPLTGQEVTDFLAKITTEQIQVSP